jgi:hypothetical protein
MARFATMATIESRPTADMALDDTALFLTRQLMENRTELTTNLPKQLVLASLGDKDDMVLAIPARMRQALI